MAFSSSLEMASTCLPFDSYVQTAGVAFTSPDNVLHAGQAQFTPGGELSLTVLETGGTSVLTSTSAPHNSAEPGLPLDFSSTLLGSGLATNQLPITPHSGAPDQASQHVPAMIFGDHANSESGGGSRPQWPDIFPGATTNGISTSTTTYTKKRPRLEPDSNGTRHSDQELDEQVRQGVVSDQDISRKANSPGNRLQSCQGPSVGQSSVMQRHSSQGRSRQSLDEVLPRPSYVLSPCNSAMRRSIGNGASFQGVPKLRGPENYDEWVRAIRAAARKEGVWDMMTGVCEKPVVPRSDAPIAILQQYNDDMTYWNNKRDLALGGIEGSLSEPLQASVDDIECTRDMWQKLEQECRPSNQKALLSTMRSLEGLSLAPGGTVERLADELRLLREKLGSLTKTEKLPDWYFSIRLLLSLGSDYNEFISSLMSPGTGFMDLGAKDSFEKVISAAIAEEKHLT